MELIIRELTWWPLEMCDVIKQYMVLVQMLCFHTNVSVSDTQWHLWARWTFSSHKNLHVLQSPQQHRVTVDLSKPTVYKLCTARPHTPHLLLSLPACCFALSDYVLSGSLFFLVHLSHSVRGRGSSNETLPSARYTTWRGQLSSTHTIRRWDATASFLPSFSVLHFMHCMCVFGYTRSNRVC